MRGNMLQHSKKATDYAHPTLMAKELVSPKDFLENIYDTTPDGIMVSDNKGSLLSKIIKTSHSGIDITNSCRAKSTFF